MASPLTRRHLLQAASSTVLGALPTLALAQAWPGRTIRFATQSAAGDPVDLRLRDFLQSLGPVLKGPTLVTDNKPGAGGVLSTQSFLHAPADGNHVLVANATMTILPAFNRKLPYDPLKDLVPVALQGQSQIGLAIPASRPEKTLEDWLRWARKQGGRLNYNSVGNGSVSHLYGYQLADTLGLQATHIPFKGATPGLLSMLAGDIQYCMLDTFTLRPLLTKGDLRLLAIAGSERNKFLPDVPTFAELGHAGFERTGWTGYFVKAGTPAPLVERLAQAMNQVNATPEWARKREELWSIWRSMTPAELARQVRSESEAWAAVVQKAGVYAE